MHTHTDLIDDRRIVNDCPASSQDLGQEGYHGRQASQGSGDRGGGRAFGKDQRADSEINFDPIISP